jgi:hypothetical protein
MSENRALNLVFGGKRGEVIGGWRKFRDKELCNVNNSLNIVWMTKLKKI